MYGAQLSGFYTTLKKMTFAQPKRSLSYGSGVSAINELDFSLATKIVFISFNQCGLFRKSGKPIKIWMGMTFRVIQQIRLQSGKQKNQSKFHQRKEKLVDWSAFKDTYTRKTLSSSAFPCLASSHYTSRWVYLKLLRKMLVLSYFDIDCERNQKLKCLISVP